MKKDNVILRRGELILKHTGVVICILASLLLASCAGSAAGADDDANAVTFTVDSELAQRIASHVSSSTTIHTARTLGNEVYENLYLDLDLLGDYTASKTLQLTPAGATVRFDGIPIGDSVSAKANAYYMDGNNRIMLCRGESESITVQKDDNSLDITMEWLSGTSVTLGITGLDDVPTSIKNSLLIDIQITGNAGYSESQTGLTVSQLPLTLDGIPVGVTISAEASAYIGENTENNRALGGGLGDVVIRDANNELSLQMNKIHIGIKPPSMAKEVYDIVFSDGSAVPYSSSLSLTDSEKAAAIAVIFYVGSACNNNNDNTTIRTLGVGLAQPATEMVWSTVKNFSVLTSCSVSGSNSSSWTFSGVKNGSVSFSKLESAGGNASQNPAFYFARNYKNSTNSHVNNTNYADNWYIPSIAELAEIYKRKTSLSNALIRCGGFSLSNDCYWSSSQSSSTEAYLIRFSDGEMQTCEKNCNSRVCAIREF